MKSMRYQYSISTAGVVARKMGTAYLKTAIKAVTATAHSQELMPVPLWSSSCISLEEEGKLVRTVQYSYFH
jgi:hypothetical protein